MPNALARGLAAAILVLSLPVLADSGSFLTRLHSFAGPSTGANAEGRDNGQLIVHSNGNVYGIRRFGGLDSGGTFFRLTPAGTFTVLQHFGTSLASGQKQARYPSVIIEDAAGDIYIGLEFGGYVAGEEGAGLVRYSPSTDTLTSLPPTPDDISLGSITGLVDGGDGYLYGTADFAIAPPPNNTRNASGAIFKVLKSTGAQTGLRFFDPQLNGEEGVDPGRIVRGADGWFYGYNLLGGGVVLPDTTRESSGTLWRINASGSSFETLHLFKKTEQGTNGETPIALTLGADGYLYGQTQTGGEDLEPANGSSSGQGVLFRYDIAGATLTPIRNRYNRDGASGGGNFTGHPLIESGEHLYTIELGSVYRIGKDGVRDSLHVFHSDDGGNFLDDLARGADGTFYVLAGSYGANNTGTISKLVLDPDPALLTLTADPTEVPNGGSTTLTWEGSGSACVSYGGGPYDGQYSEAWNGVDRPASGCARIVTDNFFGGPLRLNFSMVCEANGGHVTVSRSVTMLEEEGTPTSLPCADDGGGDGGGDPDPAELTKGEDRAIAGAEDSTQEFYIDVPAGATDLTFTTSGGSGDLDLYVRYDAPATTSTYDCVSGSATNAEECTFAAPQVGRYHVLVFGWSAFSGASLVADYTGGSGGDGGGGDGGGGGGGGAMSLGLLLLALARRLRFR